MTTTRANLIELQKALRAQYVAELEKLPFKKSVRETLADGFTDGCRQGVHHVCKMLQVEIREE